MTGSMPHAVFWMLVAACAAAALFVVADALATIRHYRDLRRQLEDERGED